MEALEDRLRRRRLGERGVQVGVEVVGGRDVDAPALAAGVRGLQHGGEPDRLERGARAREIARRGEPRLRHAGVGERAAHRDLVRHQVRRARPDPRQPERLRDRAVPVVAAVGAVVAAFPGCWSAVGSRPSKRVELGATLTLLLGLVIATAAAWSAP